MDGRRMPMGWMEPDMSPSTVRHTLNVTPCAQTDEKSLLPEVACRFVASTTKLGCGAYGVVVLGHDLHEECPVAIKFIPSSRMRNHEAALLQRLSDLNHPALLKFHGHVRPSGIRAGEVIGETGRPLAEPLGLPCHAMVTEPVYGGELFDHVIRVEGLHESESAPIFAQVCDAVHAAHLLGIAHRDIKLENCLLVHKAGDKRKEGLHPYASRVKLIDWGLAYQHGVDVDGAILHEPLHARCGSRSYMAPEVTDRDISSTIGYDGFAADVWSLGVCLFAMHTSFFPFEQANPKTDWRARKVVEAQLAGRSTMATILSFYEEYAQPGADPTSPDAPLVDAGLSAPLIALLDRMLVFDPTERATLSEVLSSEWLAPFVPSLAFLHDAPRAMPLRSMIRDSRADVANPDGQTDGQADGQMDTSAMGHEQPPAREALPRTRRVLQQMDLTLGLWDHSADLTTRQGLWDGRAEDEAAEPFSLPPAFAWPDAPMDADGPLHTLEWQRRRRDEGEHLRQCVEADDFLEARGLSPHELAAACHISDHLNGGTFDGLCIGPGCVEHTGRTRPPKPGVTGATGWDLVAMLTTIDLGGELLAASRAIGNALMGKGDALSESQGGTK